MLEHAKWLRTCSHPHAALLSVVEEATAAREERRRRALTLRRGLPHLCCAPFRAARRFLARRRHGSAAESAPTAAWSCRGSSGGNRTPCSGALRTSSPLSGRLVESGELIYTPPGARRPNTRRQFVSQTAPPLTHALAFSLLRYVQGDQLDADTIAAAAVAAAAASLERVSASAHATAEAELDEAAEQGVDTVSTTAGRVARPRTLDGKVLPAVVEAYAAEAAEQRAAAAAAAAVAEGNGSNGGEVRGVLLFDREVLP